MAAAVGIVRGKHRTGIAVDDDGGELRAVALARLVAGVMAGVVAMPVAARLGAVAGVMIAVVRVTSPRTQTRNVREEAKFVRSIYFPVPISILITGS